MKLTFLGTGTSQGVPVIACHCAVCTSHDVRDQRLRTSAMVEVNGRTFVIDTGPDFRQQMLRARVDRLDAVIFTHHHKDHTAGLDDIRAFNFRQGTPMDVYANGLTIEALQKEFAYVFAEDKYPGVPSVHLNEIGRDPFEVHGQVVTPIPVMHHLMPVLGFRIGDLAYVTDASHIPPHSMERLAGLKVLVLNALRREKHISHFNLEEAIAVAKELKAEQTWFTHISHLMGRHADVEETLPEGIRIAYDGLQLEL